MSVHIILSIGLISSVALFKVERVSSFLHCQSLGPVSAMQVGLKKCFECIDVSLFALEKILKIYIT